MFEDATGLHEHHAVSDGAGEGHFVGDDQQGHAIAGQALDHFQHFLDHLRVEGGGDFIKQHDLRVHAQRTDDGDALLLAAGQLAREGIAFVGEPHARQQFLCLLTGFTRVAFLHFQRAEQDVVEHAHVREQVVALEHHAHVLAHLTPVGVFVQQLLAGKPQAAAVGDFQPIEAAQQGAFAAATGAEDHHHFAALHAQVDALEHLRLAEKFVETLELDQCAHAWPQRRSSTLEAADNG
ncbi:hypothetical protein [Pseudomonas sp. 22 E 5]|nr:hypothetical protein [Pseudomonas sp. 22 E 5]